MVTLNVGNDMGSSERRNEDQRNPHPSGEGQAVRSVGKNPGRNVVIEAVGLVVGDDDRALVPDPGLRGDGVDRAGDHGFAELPVRIRGVIVVSGFCFIDGRNLIRGRGGIRNHRLHSKLVGISPPNKEDASGRKGIRSHVREKISHSTQIGTEFWRVRDISKILGTVVMADVGRMGSRPGGIRRFQVITFLVPVPAHGRSPLALDIRYILLDIREIECWIPVAGQSRSDILPEESQGQAGKREIGGDVGIAVILIGSGRLPTAGGRIELRPIEGLRVVDERYSLSRPGVAAYGVLLTVRIHVSPIESHQTGPRELLRRSAWTACPPWRRYCQKS